MNFDRDVNSEFEVYEFYDLYNTYIFNRIFNNIRDLYWVILIRTFHTRSAPILSLLANTWNTYIHIIEFMCIKKRTKDQRERWYLLTRNITLLAVCYSWSETEKVWEKIKFNSWKSEWNEVWGIGENIKGEDSFRNEYW